MKPIELIQPGILFLSGEQKVPCVRQAPPKAEDHPTH